MKPVQVWLVALLAIFAPIKAAVLSVIVLVFADLILGVSAAVKQNEPITSSGLKTTVIKLAIYEVAILLAFLAQTYLTGSILPVCNLATAVVGLTELKSILENLDIIAGGSFFQSLIDKVNNSNKTLDS
jgi:FtsH-binding integral membrane protein